MGERIHFIPVGFDFERLIYPISKGNLEADHVVLLDTGDNGTPSRSKDLAGRMVQRLEDAFDLIDVDVEIYELPLDELYVYEDIYPIAHTQIVEKLESGFEVYVNISSMPRTVAFAFATAADSIIAEEGEFRDQLHTYYVAPEDYLVLDMIETLEDERQFLRDAQDQGGSMDFDSRIEDVEEMLDKIGRKGVTEGARTMPNDNLYVEFPASPGSGIEEFDGTILRVLDEQGPIRSTSRLAEKLAEELGQDYDQSFRGRAQYHVRTLDDEGYIEREKQGNRYRTQLSTMGEMWVEARKSRECEE